jgi:hypothetical protein
MCVSANQESSGIVVFHPMCEMVPAQQSLPLEATTETFVIGPFSAALVQNSSVMEFVGRTVKNLSSTISKGFSVTKSSTAV